MLTTTTLTKRLVIVKQLTMYLSKLFAYINAINVDDHDDKASQLRKKAASFAFE